MNLNYIIPKKISNNHRLVADPGSDEGGGVSKIP